MTDVLLHEAKLIPHSTQDMGGQSQSTSDSLRSRIPILDTRHPSIAKPSRTCPKKSIPDYLDRLPSHPSTASTFQGTNKPTIHDIFHNRAPRFQSNSSFI